MANSTSETLALEALEFLAQDEERLSALLGTTGLTPEGLVAIVQSSEGLASILDYLLENEALLLDFANSQNLRPEMILKARLRLPNPPSW